MSKGARRCTIIVMARPIKNPEVLAEWGIDVDQGGHVAVKWQNCGRHNCNVCTAGPNQGHGPYAYYRRPKTKEKYLGRCNEEGYPYGNGS